ncbi:ATP-binding cassette sub-family F member 1-like [Meleagris gallopavo]|uniref:ATP-binding cassette sub-family F member 1-like n=1 Tax=Meleagris gallopavo TaxID=9103 RepID=UPI0012AC01C2|nr:ATP-binding cassette sub-family F member 1-like [Meleagris gallopavo]
MPKGAKSAAVREEEWKGESEGKEQPVKKGKKDRRAKKSFFEELAEDHPAPQIDAPKPAEKEPSAPQPRRRRRKKKGDARGRSLSRKGRSLSRNSRSHEIENIFSALSLEEEEEEEEGGDEGSQPQKKKQEEEEDGKRKKNRKNERNCNQRRNQFAALLSNEEEEREEEEAEGPGSPAPKTAPAPGSPTQKADPAPGSPAPVDEVAEEEKENGGKKGQISKKERKKLKKQLDYQRQVATMAAAAEADSDFAVSQAELSARQAMLENAADIKVCGAP